MVPPNRIVTSTKAVSSPVTQTPGSLWTWTCSWSISQSCDRGRPYPFRSSIWKKEGGQGLGTYAQQIIMVSEHLSRFFLSQRWQCGRGMVGENSHWYVCFFSLVLYGGVQALSFSRVSTPLILLFAKCWISESQW